MPNRPSTEIQMPFIRVDWFPGRTLEQKRELAEVLTREFARIAKCKPETINFIFTEVGREDWGRNGKLFCDAYEYENESEPEPEPGQSERGTDESKG